MDSQNGHGPDSQNGQGQLDSQNRHGLDSQNRQGQPDSQNGHRLDSQYLSPFSVPFPFQRVPFPFPCVPFPFRACLFSIQCVPWPPFHPLTNAYQAVFAFSTRFIQSDPWIHCRSSNHNAHYCPLLVIFHPITALPPLPFWAEFTSLFGSACFTSRTSFWPCLRHGSLACSLPLPSA